MEITKTWLKKKNACKGGFDWFVANHKSIDGIELVEKLIEINTDWANWLITRMLNRKQCLECTIFAAEKVLHIFEEKHPNDKRPRLAIEAAKAVLFFNTKKNRDAAYAASDAAAAYASGAFASTAAAYASFAATASGAFASTAAASNAAASSSGDKLKKEIILNGIEIYKRGKK